MQSSNRKVVTCSSHEGAGAIKDNYRKAVTAVLLENTEKQLREERGMINEASNTVGAIGTDALSGSWSNHQDWWSCRFRSCNDLPNPSCNA